MLFRSNALITQRSENLRKARKLSTIIIQEGFIVNVLVVDVGGSNVKILATGQTKPRKFPSGPELTAKQMVNRVKKLAGGWKYDVVSIGYPGPVLRNRPLAEPYNLGTGWLGFDFGAAFEHRVKVVNDAAMQALGSYKRGKMLFLGLGTGLGSAMIANGNLEPMELGHLPYKKGTYEDYVGMRGLQKRGKKKWRRNVADVVGLLVAALEPDDVVLGGGNVRKLKDLPKGCRIGDNSNAFRGGFRLWEKGGDRRHSPSAKTRNAKKRKGSRLRVVTGSKSAALEKASYT
jgi:polyphosphate glucokinase